jgi:OOP family OmpA-OmpF porin
MQGRALQEWWKRSGALDTFWTAQRRETKIMAWRSAGAVATLLFLVSAHAQDSGVYIGGSYGRSKTKIDTAALDASLTGPHQTPVTVANDRDTGRKLFLGYRINQYFAVEGAYANLGKFTANTNLLGQVGFFPGPPVTIFLAKQYFTITPKQVVYLSGLAGIPLLQRGLVYARLGVYDMKVELTSDTNNGVGYPRSDSGAGPVFGAGVQYDVIARLGIRAEWERFRNAGGDNTGKHDFDLFTAGIVYRF